MKNKRMAQAQVLLKVFYLTVFFLLFWIFPIHGYTFEATTEFPLGTIELTWWKYPFGIEYLIHGGALSPGNYLIMTNIPLTILSSFLITLGILLNIINASKKVRDFFRHYTWFLGMILLVIGMMFFQISGAWLVAQGVCHKTGTLHPDCWASQTL